MQQEQEMQQVQQVHQLPHLPPGVVGHAELQGAGGGLGEVLAARLEATQASCRAISPTRVPNLRDLPRTVRLVRTECT